MARPTRPVKPIDFPYVLVKPDGEWVSYTSARTYEEVAELIGNKGWSKDCKVGQVTFAPLPVPNTANSWTVYCHWLKGVGEADNQHPMEQWFDVAGGKDEKEAKEVAARWNAEHSQHHYQAFPPAVYPWD